MHVFLPKRATVAFTANTSPITHSVICVRKGAKWKVADYIHTHKSIQFVLRSRELQIGRTVTELASRTRLRFPPTALSLLQLSSGLEHHSVSHRLPLPSTLFWASVHSEVHTRKTSATLWGKVKGVTRLLNMTHALVQVLSLKLYSVALLLYQPSFLPKLRNHIFHVFLDHGIICYCPLSSPASVKARRSARAALWPPLPDRLTACQRVSETLGTVTGHQPRQISDSLGVWVCVGYCGEGCSAYDSLMLLVGLSRLLYSGPYLAS